MQIRHESGKPHGMLGQGNAEAKAKYQILERLGNGLCHEFTPSQIEFVIIHSIYVPCRASWSTLPVCIGIQVKAAKIDADQCAQTRRWQTDFVGLDLKALLKN